MHDVRKVVDLMSDVQARTKRHILIFDTQFGQVTLATDDLNEVSQQSWFKKFIDAVFDVSYQPPEEDVQIPTQQAAPQAAGAPVGQARQVRQEKSWFGITPDRMDVDTWRKMSPEQQREYTEYYGLGK